MKFTIPKTPAERAEMLRKAEALRAADGSFKDDAAREEFDARMEAIEAYDTKPAPSPVPAPPDADAIRADERKRITDITSAVRLSGLGAELGADMIGRGITIDAARAEVFALMAKADKAKADTDPHRGIEMGEDTRDKFVRGVTNWLLVKSGMSKLVADHDKQPVADPGEFRGLSLLDIARECLVRAGVNPRGLEKMALASRAFTLRAGTQSTSDFTYALENTMHKVLLASFAITPDTWSKWCARGTVSDFRAHNRYRMGSFASLDALAENGEFKTKAITDADKASITATTKGNKINVSRQMIVNDDMGVFSGLLTGLGRAASLSIEVDAYALLAENGGLGPTFGSAPVFDAAAHYNLNSTGSALSAAAIEADAAVLSRQMDKDRNDYLDLQPAILLVERALRGTALTINEAQYDPDTANKLQKPNTVRGLFRDVVATPRFTAASTRRYLFADPAIAPVFEVAFLEGQESPVLETQNGWNTDGAEMRVRFDYAVGAVGFTGAVTNAGT